MIRQFKLLYVYILRCADGSYYTGVTNNVERRVSEHNIGEDKSCYTYKRRPVELMYADMFKEYHQTIEFEKQVKRWTRKKKEALIEENWDKLKVLSACNNLTSSKLMKK